jgi:hypothetical protein
MPLPPPTDRELLTRRTITCEGHRRADGLFDVEGHLVDTRGYVHEYGSRPPIPPGGPIHEMRVRMTVDSGGRIVAILAATDSAPYLAICREVVPNLERLVGLKIAGGFKQAMRERVGSTDGCTHIVTLLEAMANNAVQTLAASVREQGSGAVYARFGLRDQTRHPLLDTCHTYAASSPVVASLWPEHHRPAAADAAAEGPAGD